VRIVNSTLFTKYNVRASFAGVEDRRYCWRHCRQKVFVVAFLLPA
jgi:hypothetical protein